MDAKTFDDLVARIFRGASRRETVKGVLSGAVAAAGVPRLAEATHGKNKRKNRKGKGDKAKAHDEGKDTKGTRQVSAAGKKPFCLCPGTIEANCTATNCVNCVSQGEIGKGQRKKLKKANPLSFVGECLGTTTTTTTTPRVCGGSCQVGSNTCAQFGNTCLCVPNGLGRPSFCAISAGTCGGQPCTPGATDRCAEFGFGFNCVCISSGLPGRPSFCTTIPAD